MLPWLGFAQAWHLVCVWHHFALQGSCTAGLSLLSCSSSSTCLSSLRILSFLSSFLPPIHPLFVGDEGGWWRGTFPVLGGCGVFERKFSFFHREAAHCIDVNRALAVFELLWFACPYVCQNLFEKREILVTLCGRAAGFLLPLCCAFHQPITPTCSLWFSVLSKLFEKLCF